MTTRQNLSSRGFTLVEMMVTTAVMAIVGMLVFLVLNTGMILYAKNTSVNSAHQQARAGIDQMLTNIHSSVSIPQLVDGALQPVAVIVDPAGSPVPAVGISFQSFSAGPFPVVVSAAATSTSITLYCPGYTPVINSPTNLRLNIPSHNIEFDVASSSAAGSNRQFNLIIPPPPPSPTPTPVPGIGTAVSIAGSGIEGASGVSYIITAFLTLRSSYAVVKTSTDPAPYGGELRYYSTNNLATYKIITRNIVSSTPFTIPLLPNGSGLQNRFVAAINISTSETKFSNRKYRAVDMSINSLIPFRCRLTNLQ